MITQNLLAIWKANTYGWNNQPELFRGTDDLDLHPRAYMEGDPYESHLIGQIISGSNLESTFGEPDNFFGFTTGSGHITDYAVYFLRDLTFTWPPSVRLNQVFYHIDNPIFNSMNSFTIAAWMQTPGYPNGGNTFFCKGNYWNSEILIRYHGQAAMVFGVNNGTTQIFCQLDDPTWVGKTTPQPPDWNLGFFSYDDATHTMRIDVGSKDRFRLNVSSAEVSWSVSTGSITIGGPNHSVGDIPGANWTNGEYLPNISNVLGRTGAYEYVFIWDKILTDGEKIELWNNGDGLLLTKFQNMVYNSSSNDLQVNSVTEQSEGNMLDDIGNLYIKGDVLEDTTLSHKFIFDSGSNLHLRKLTERLV